MKKQDLNRLDNNTNHHIIEYNRKGLRNVKKQDFNSLDHNVKEVMAVMELEEKKPMDKTIFGNNKKKAG